MDPNRAWRPRTTSGELRATKAALAEEAEARQRAEVGWQQETAQRTAIEQALAAETAARRQADGARRQDELGRSAAEQALAAETTARRQAQALARREAAQRMAAEQGLGDEREARQRAEAAYQAIANATLWKLVLRCAAPRGVSPTGPGGFCAVRLRSSGGRSACACADA